MIAPVALGALVGAALIAAPTVAGATVAGATTEPPSDHDREWYEQQAEADFQVYLNSEFGSGDEISNPPYCLVSFNLTLATCEALIEGTLVRAQGTFSPVDEMYGDWLPPEEAQELRDAEAAEAAAAEAAAEDAAAAEAQAEAKSEAIDELESYGTSLGDAVAACLQLDTDDDGDPFDLTFHDHGHSVWYLGSDDELTECIAEALGLPEWVAAQISNTHSDLASWTMVVVNGYTVTWTGDEVIIYDDEVA